MKQPSEMTLRELVGCALMAEQVEFDYNRSAMFLRELERRLPEIEAAVDGMKRVVRARRLWELYQEGHCNGVEYTLAQDEANAALDAYSAAKETERERP